MIPANILAMFLGAAGSGVNPIVWNSISAENGGAWGIYTNNYIAGQVTTSGGTITNIAYNWDGGAWNSLPITTGAASVTFSNISVPVPLVGGNPAYGGHTLNIRATDSNGNQRVTTLGGMSINQTYATWSPFPVVPNGTLQTTNIFWGIPGAAVTYTQVYGPSGATAGPTSAGTLDSNGFGTFTGTAAWPGADTSDLVTVYLNGTAFFTFGLRIS